MDNLSILQLNYAIKIAIACARTVRWCGGLPPPLNPPI